MTFNWIVYDAVVTMHDLQIAEHGGGEGLRDPGRLEATLARPVTILAYEPDADVARLAAAYAHGIAKGHPFVDGNKRTAFVVMETFLILNGYALTANDPACLNTVLGLASGGLSEGAFADWLRAHLASLEDNHA